MMWRTVLVDDEEYVRAELAELFPWEQYHFRLIGEANTARLAMALIEKAHPDLVITDIRMPEMDGLELISWMVQHYPDIAVAVVSAYNDFPYVREALRLGASDYLIKAEATPETTGEFLERIGGILKERRSTHYRQRKLADNMARYRLLASESFWRDLLTGTSDQKEIQDRSRQLGIDLEGYWFGLIFIHISNYQEKSGAGEKLRMLLEREISSIPNCNWQWDIINLNRDDFVVVASQKGQRPMSDDMEKLQEIAYNLGTYTAARAQIAMTTSVSSEICGFSCLPASFKEVREVNLLRLYHWGKGYIPTKDLLNLRQAPPPDIPKLLAAWEEVLRGGGVCEQEKAIHDFLHNLFINIIPICLIPEEARRLVLDLIHTLRWILFEYKVCWEEIIGEERDYLESIEQADFIDQWHDILKRLAFRYVQFVKEKKVSVLHPQVSSTIRKALAYIQGNFARDLSLEEVATHAGVSMSYLSRIFPEHVGENFSAYLRRLRIERAKELLRFSTDYIYEIALKVGFWNSRYFSKIFHEEVGMTPADYRRTPQTGVNEINVE